MTALFSLVKLILTKKNKRREKFFLALLHLVLGRFMAPKGRPNRLEPRDIEGELEEFVSSFACKMSVIQNVPFILHHLEIFVIVENPPV